MTTTTTTTTTTTADLRQTAADLRQAAAASARHGWSRGALRGVDDTLCAVGAMRTGLAGDVYTKLDHVQEQRLLDMCAALVPLLPARFQPEPAALANAFDVAVYRGVVRFNDYDCKSGDEIQLLFTQAAEKLEAEL